MNATDPLPAADTPPTHWWIIRGVTYDGEVFRPSDWAERACGPLSRFENCRVKYSSLLYPAMVQGHKCVVFHPSLAYTHPELFQYLEDFAKSNQLPLYQGPTPS